MRCAKQKIAIEAALTELRAYRNEAAASGDITKAERINATVLRLRELAEIEPAGAAA